MGQNLTTNPVALASGFHALSDTTRIQLVELLRNGERCVCELMDALDAAQSRLSFHLKVLKEAGLVTDRREGRWVYYTLNADALGALESYVSEVRTASGTRQLPTRSAACCE
jgi:ArsR family transcriptional regulator